MNYSSLKGILKTSFDSCANWLKPIRLIFLLMILFSLGMGIFQAANAGFTTDEYAHLGAIESYRNGLGLNPEHPLGQKIVASVWYSIFFSNISPTDQKNVNTDQYLRGILVLEAAKDDSRAVIFWIRMVFVFTNLLIFAWLWLLTEKGWLSSIFATTFGFIYLFSPSFSSHTALITFDVAGSSSLFMLLVTLGLSIIYFKKWNQKPSKVVFLIYFLLFWALNTKFSNVMVLLPFIIWLVSIFWLIFADKINTKKERIKELTKHFILNIFSIFTVLLSIWLIYTWSFGAVDLNYIQLPNGFVISKDSNFFIFWKELWYFFEPLLKFSDGVLRTFGRSGDVQSPFLFGNFENISLLHFSTIIFWFKENTIFLLGFVVTIFYIFYRFYNFIWQIFSSKIKFSNFKISWIIAAIIIASVPLLYAIISANRYLVIGYRHSYPILIFVFGLVAFVVWLLSLKNPHFNKKFLVIWFVIMGTLAFFAQPYGISYLNNFTSQKRSDVVNDSTYNWGQEHIFGFKFLTSIQTNSENIDLKVGLAGFPISVKPNLHCFIETNSAKCNNLSIQNVDLSQPLDTTKYNYFILDSHIYQLIISGNFGQNGTLNLQNLSKYPVVFNSKDVLWIYKISDKISN